MSGSRRARSGAGGALALLLLLGVGQALLVPRVEEARVESRIARVSEPGLEVPAEIRLLEASLGSFRGALINVLWLRAIGLEEEGRVHESLQLARWITRLQPSFPRVWSYQARNLSDNLSVTASDPGERYAWVQEGIGLLRDEGIPLNRESMHLYRELAYIFWFKLGDESRDEHRLDFWRRFATEWDELLGEPAGETAEERAAWLRPLAEAPVRLDALVAARPGLAARREEWASLLAEGARAHLAAAREDERSGASMTGDEQALLNFLRAHVLREEFSMDPALMLDLTEQLGPIDWRHPAAHSIYWATTGLLRIRTGEAFPRFTRELRGAVEEDHIVSIALKQLLLRGRILGDPRRVVRRAPELSFIDAYERGIFEGDPGSAAEVPEDYRVSYFQILELGVQGAWLRGDEELARRLLSRLARFFGETIEDPVEWIVTQLELDLPEEEPERTRELEIRITLQLYAMMEEGWGSEDERLASRRRALAELLWGRAALAGAFLDPLERIEARAVGSFLQESPLLVTATAKAAVWARLSPERRASFPPWLLEQLRDAARRAGLDPETAFPTP